ncbi:STE3-domain-containing protein [Tricholoma matsutake]|nr:STE3-domain-containing protein [Tricholoma matsutake 945]
MHVEMPLGALFAALLVLVPLPWHWRARNVPTLSMIAWLFVSNVIFAVNSIVWADSVDLVVPVWCDITTKIQIGSTLALPACCLCICIHLERISSTRQVQSTDIQKRRRMVFDIVMCWGLPMVHMALHYIVQGHRYDLVEVFGCRPAIYTSIESILIIWTLPLVMVALTFVYASLALHHFFRRRVMFARHLQNSNSALTTGRYFRLMSMAVLQMFWNGIMMAINVWFSCRDGLRPWISWDDVHSNFPRIAQFPTIFITAEVLSWTQFMWWTVPISGFLFFVFFSFGTDAMKEYKLCINWVLRVIFHRKGQDVKSSTLPSFVRVPPPVYPIARPQMSMTPTNDTESTICDESRSAPHKARPASVDISSSFIATPSSIVSFPTSDSNSTFVATIPSLHTHTISTYSSRADEHV